MSVQAVSHRNSAQVLLEFQSKTQTNTKLPIPSAGPLIKRQAQEHPDSSLRQKRIRKVEPSEVSRPGIKLHLILEYTHDEIIQITQKGLIKPTPTELAAYQDDTMLDATNDSVIKNLIDSLLDEQIDIFNKITESCSASICKQIVDLLSLCHLYKKGHRYSIQKIINFALNLGLHISDQMIQDTQTEREYGKIIAKLMLLVEHNLHTIVKNLSKKDIPTSLKEIDSSFKALLSSVKYRNKQHHEQHNHQNLQSAQTAWLRRCTMEMSKLLLMGIGSVNVEIMEEVADHLLADFKESVVYRNIKYILKQLAQEPELCRLISAVMPPASADNPANEMIRACLGISTKAPISKKDAQIVLLSAILHPIRQVKGPTCTVTSLLIKIYNTDLKSCIIDYSELIRSGALKRLVDSEFKSFSFQACTSYNFENKNLVVSADGKILKLNSQPLPIYSAPYLQDAPGLLQACRALQIENAKEAILHILGQLKQPFTIFDFMKGLATHAYEGQKKVTDRFQSHLEIADLIDKALYSYEAQTCHQLHRAWEQSVANMNNYYSSQQSFPLEAHGALTTVMNRLTKGTAHTCKRVLKMVTKEMFLPMTARMNYRYNYHHADRMKAMESDQWSSHYGFELFDSGASGDSLFKSQMAIALERESSELFHPDTHQAWNAVDSAEKFQDFIISIMMQTVNHLQSKPDNSLSSKQWKETSNLFADTVRSKRFTNLMVKFLFRQRTKRKKTPWKIEGGMHTTDIIQSYYNIKEIPVKTLLFSGTPREVLAWIINYLKKQPKRIQDQFSNPFSSIHTRQRGNHAFLLMAGFPTLREAYLSKLNTVEYITEKVQVPGKEVANQIIPIAMRIELIKYMREDQNIEIIYGISSSDYRHAFSRKVATQPTQVTIRDFRSQLIQISKQILLEHDKTPKHDWMQETTVALDQKIYDLLSYLTKKQLIDSMIVAFDTNWVNEICPEYFAFMVNPGNGELEMIRYGEDTKKVQFIDQAEWFPRKKNREWALPDNFREFPRQDI